jgi:hypothetical protein
MYVPKETRVATFVVHGDDPYSPSVFVVPSSHPGPITGKDCALMRHRLQVLV